MYVLVDCNNFYVSCERVFQPALNKKPLVVLSNNNGCVVARSEEVKALGVKMGAPYFKNKDLFEKNKVLVFSSNYKLYADISSRVMNILSSLNYEIEIYSIDEAFIKIKENTSEVLEFIKLRARILKEIGIPVSIGIAPNKILAKLANKVAKKNPKGIFLVRASNEIDYLLKEIDIEAIWGISKNFGFRLKALGYRTAYQLKNADPKLVGKKLNINIEKIVLELNDKVCLGLEIAKTKKSITSSRSFSSPVYKLADIEEALANYTATACEKLRSQKSFAGAMTVYLMTNRFKEDFYFNSINMFFQHHNDTASMIKEAKFALRKIFKEGFEYKKVAILLFNLTPEVNTQVDLFYKPKTERLNLMKKIDEFNKLSKNTIFYAAQGIQRSWGLRCDKKSPEYTTNWNELLVVR